MNSLSSRVKQVFIKVLISVFDVEHLYVELGNQMQKLKWPFLLNLICLFIVSMIV